MSKVTIQDVAREAGVALGTVSNALNHPEKLRASTLQVITEAMNRLGYVPNQSARLLAGGKTASFGLVLPRLDHGFSLQVANGAHSEARRNGYGLLIANADNDDGLEESYVRYFMGTQMAGVLVQPMAESDWRPRGSAYPVPIVYLDVQCDEPGYYVAPDSRAQGRLVAEHALSCGARRVAVVGKHDGMQIDLRIRGVQDVQAINRGALFEFIDEGAGGLAQDGYMIGTRLAQLAQAERPDFVIGLTDVLATGVIAGVQDAGCRVPDDIAVAGCDGNPLAWTGNVPLTTCAPLGYEVGRRGVQFLIEQIEAARAGTLEDEAQIHQTLVRPFMLSRQSTSPNRDPHIPVTPSLDLGRYL